MYPPELREGIERLTGSDRPRSRLGQLVLAVAFVPLSLGVFWASVTGLLAIPFGLIVLLLSLILPRLGVPSETLGYLSTAGLVLFFGLSVIGSASLLLWMLRQHRRLGGPQSP